MPAFAKKPARRLPKGTPLVLVVDDAADTREMYEEYLSFSGLRTSTAADGAEALRKAEEEQPDVIALDISLPVIDGWEVVRRLRTNPKTKHICVIALTGWAEAEAGAMAAELGCDAFLAKPCMPEQLLREVLACRTKKR